MRARRNRDAARRGDGGGTARHPGLEQADAWAARHGALLTACYARFTASGEWPELEALQHDFELAGVSTDVRSTAWEMPGELGFVERERLVLRVRALRSVPEARPLLDDWCAVLRHAYARWLDDPKSRLSRSDVRAVLDGDVRRADRVSALLLRESWAFGSGVGSQDDEWQRELHSALRVARDARSPDALLDARDAVELPALAQVEPTPNRQAAGRKWRRVWAFASNNPLVAGVLASLIVAALGAAAAVLKAGGSDQAGAPPPSESTEVTTAQTVPRGGSAGVREQAGSGGARAYANPRTLSGEAERVEPGAWVLVSCKIYSPEPPSVTPDGFWYRLRSAPWRDQAYAPANSFWNGDVPGHRPYLHNVDRAVPNC